MATEQHQHVHQHVHFTPAPLDQVTDERLDRTEAGYTKLVALEQEVRRMRPCSGRASVRGPQTAPPGTPRTRVSRIDPPTRQR